MPAPAHTPGVIPRSASSSKKGAPAQVPRPTAPGRAPKGDALLRLLEDGSPTGWHPSGRVEPDPQRITNGSSPRKRARLMAADSSRCFLADTAVMREGTILPRSEM